ncbi:unnamed protein product [Meloidogyne enterolobii]|uniref:Uncharacterized protein n=2 Tax=Meloidogyne enterolobii TaxID=390850 RepID=A0ACB1B670_MELEN
MFARKIYKLNRTDNDFIWIHDYHLLFVGRYLRKMENEEQDNVKPMKLGFFLHTPFEFPANLAKKLTEKVTEEVSEESSDELEEEVPEEVSEKSEELPVELSEEVKANLEKLTKEIIIGILSFDKVGFQTNKDRYNFIELAQTVYLIFYYQFNILLYFYLTKLCRC